MGYKDNDSMIKAYQEGQQKELLTEILENNLKLIYIALKEMKWMYAQHPKYDQIISFEDLFQEGSIGLSIAIKKYNPEKGMFSTYAITYIKSSIFRFYYNNSRVIRIPYNPQQAYKELRQAENKYIIQYGFHPNTAELSAYSGISIKEIQELRGIFSGTVSIDSPIGSEDESITLKDAIPDKTDYIEGIEHIMTVKALRKDLEIMADDVIKNKKHIKIMFSYFDNLDSMLVKDIAEINNIDVGRLNRIVSECIRKLSVKYLDILINEYSDLFSSNVRRIREQDLYRAGIRSSIKLVASKTLKIKDNITVIDLLSENSLKESIQATVREIDEEGIKLSYIGYDFFSKTYKEQRKFIRFSSIRDYRSENKRIVEIATMRGLI